MHPLLLAKQARRSIAPWVFIIFWLLILALVAVLVLSLANIYQGEVILSGVTALGQDLGGRTRSEASQIIKTEWQNRKVILDAGEQSWTLSPEQLGVILDADAMAEAAYQQGRGQPGLDSLVPTARRILASSGLFPLGRRRRGRHARVAALTGPLPPRRSVRWPGRSMYRCRTRA